MSRHLLLPPQVAQGALLCAFFRPPQDYVFCSLEGAPRQAQRASYSPRISKKLSLIRLSSRNYRLVHYRSVRMTRSGLSVASTRAGRARSPRSTVRSGSSTSTGSSATSPTARPHPSASTPATLSSPPSSSTRTAAQFWRGRTARRTRVRGKARALRLT